jgi:hypothetical protein
MVRAKIWRQGRPRRETGVPVRFLSVKPAAQPTLYEVLSSPAPQGAVAGETILTLSKETLDNDDEAMMLGLILDG